jgi:hypothetical protein
MMIRAFLDNKRIATAVLLHGGSILQVYPTKEMSENEETWRAKWALEGVTFQNQERQQVDNAQRLSRAEKAAKLNVVIYCSLPKADDTPLQALIRKIYNQEGIRDSIRSTAKNARDAYYGMRLDPGVYVMLPESGMIEPVYFNRKSGLVIFGNKDETNEPVDGLKFYRKNGCSLAPIRLVTDEQGPDQKSVIVCNLPSVYKSYAVSKMIRTLREAGFFVYTYNYRWCPSPEAIREMFRVMPRCQGVLWDVYNENISYFDLTSTNLWSSQSANFNKWIEEHK